MSSDKAEKAFNFAGDQWIKKVVRKGNGHLAQEGCQCKLRINGLIKLEIPFLGQWKDRFVFDSDTLLTHAIVHLVTLSLIEGELCELKNHEVVFSIELIECTVVRPSTQRRSIRLAEICRKLTGDEIEMRIIKARALSNIVACQIRRIKLDIDDNLCVNVDDAKVMLKRIERNCTRVIEFCETLGDTGLLLRHKSLYRRALVNAIGRRDYLEARKDLICARESTSNLNGAVERLYDIVIREIKMANKRQRERIKGLFLNSEN
ncbi:hypothetical protein ACOME3_006824 [Neoechinorhynchus agilis]